jgi:hypothetical protein
MSAKLKDLIEDNPGCYLARVEVHQAKPFYILGDSHDNTIGLDVSTGSLKNASWSEKQVIEALAEIAGIRLDND